MKTAAKLYGWFLVATAAVTVLSYLFGPPFHHPHGGAWNVPILGGLLAAGVIYVVVGEGKFIQRCGHLLILFGLVVAVLDLEGYVLAEVSNSAAFKGVIVALAFMVTGSSIARL